MSFVDKGISMRVDLRFKDCLPKLAFGKSQVLCERDKVFIGTYYVLLQVDQENTRICERKSGNLPLSRNYARTSVIITIFYNVIHNLVNVCVEFF